MDWNIKISVIVTVHNAEKYLRECLDSVVGQTFPHIEIICIDGGSVDFSPQILLEYAEKDKRIRIVNDPNTSYGHKVNEGIKQARGEYISVLESDDMYLPDMLERLYEIAQQYHPDFVNADYLEFWDMDGKRYKMLKPMYPEQDYGRLLESRKHPENMRQILRYWTGIFKKDFLIKRKIQMNESPGASFQDMSFRFLTSALADTCYHIKMPVYLYRVDNPDSSVYDPKKAASIADEYDFLESELKYREIKDPHLWRHFYIWKYADFYNNMLRFEGDAREALARRCYKELEMDRLFLDIHGGREYSALLFNLLSKPETEILEELENVANRIKNTERQRIQWYQQLRDRKVVIFGCGVLGRQLWDILYPIREQIQCFTDNNQELWGKWIEGCPIFSPESTVEKYSDAHYIVANKLHAEQIKSQLLYLKILDYQIDMFTG